jgi:pimeloyl-ACP methyl ester carboxylesterase
MPTASHPIQHAVLVHGGWHCGASWGAVSPLIRRAGHRVTAVDLPGHGWRARFPEGYLTADQTGFAEAPGLVGDGTLRAAADAVLDELRAVRAGDPADRIVLVSHSSAGAIASLAAETAPELVDHLVYVAAIVPSRLTSALEVAALPEYGSQTMDGLVIGDPAASGVLRLNPRSTDPAYRALLRNKFYTDLSAEQAEPFLNLLVPDQPLGFIAEPVTVTSDRWGSVPRTYIFTSQDQSIAPAVQHIMVDDADALHPQRPFRRVVIDSSHSPFASQPQRLADLIIGASSG